MLSTVFNFFKSMQILKISSIRWFAILLVVLSFYHFADGQPVALKGSYASSATDGVDVFSGRLEQTIPLHTVQGRGEAAHGLYLPLRNADWQVVQTDVYQDQYEIRTYYQAKLGYQNYGVLGSEANLAALSRGGYGMVGKISARTNHGSINLWTTPAVTGLTFISNDGSIIELRDVQTNGQPLDARDRGCLRSIYDQNQVPQICSRGRVFKATDGSNAIFVADADVYDEIRYDPFYSGVINNVHHVSGTLFLANGTRMIFGNNLPDVDGNNVNLSSMIDRNGNYLNFEYSSSIVPGYYLLTKIVDSLKRETVISYGDHSQATFHDDIHYKGFGSADRTIRINYGAVENSMLPGHSLTPIFPGVRGTCFMIAGGNPCAGYPQPYGSGTPANSQKVISSIELPNAKQYNFYYNEYLELARIKNPLGSRMDYDYSGRLLGSDADGFTSAAWGGGSIARRVTSVKSFDESGQLVNQKYFGPPPQYVPATQTTINNVTIEVKDGSGVSLSKSKHYFYGTQEDLASARPWRTGKEYRSEVLDTATNAVLRAAETTWEQREAFPWCSTQGLGFYSCDEVNFPGSSPFVDPRVTETKTTLENGLVSKKTMAYDQFNNLTDSYEFDYGSGAAGQFLRREHTDYLADPNYTSHTGANLRRLPLNMWVSSDQAGSNKTSYTSYEYDNLSLVSRSNASMHDTANFSTGNVRRGNATKITIYSDAQNQTGAVITQNQYDILGNLVKSTDPKGFITNIDFTDRFGTPDAEARSNSNPASLVGQNAFAFPTSMTNPLGHIVYRQYEFFTSSVVDSEDINETVSSTFYTDTLDRPTQTIDANNRPPLRRQKSFVYNDAEKKVTTTSDLYSFGDNLKVQESFYNSLGLSTESRDYETGGYVVTSKVLYDALGRTTQTAAPYRPYLNEQPAWTTSTFDSIGRVVRTKTPDDLETNVSFSGNVTTVTDPSNRKRRSVMNALNELIRVDEPDSSNNLGDVTNPTQPTYYTYNSNGKMVKVVQGQQNRFFLYDSVGRLIRVRQPEQGTHSSLALADPLTGNSQWSAGTTFDANGNTLTVTDAKGITTTQTYDSLNRVLARTYSDGTPAVSYEYENPAIPFNKGKLTKISSSISTTQYLDFDAAGKVKMHRQTVDGQAYDTLYAYGLSGALEEETYPSGRLVRSDYDVNGKLENVSSKAGGQNFFFTYADNFVYTSIGEISSVRLGNGNWASAQYNSRSQIMQISLGTSQNAFNLWKINYEYGESDSNGYVDPQKNIGNIARETVNFTGLSQPFVQTFKYDRLSRLSEAKEMSGSTQTWSQNFSYDRYGNRTGYSKQVGSQQTNQTPAIDPLTNKFSSGQGFTYDLNGNLVQDDQGYQYTFNGDNRQVEVRNPANNTVGLYYYDGSGKRVKKVTASETTIFVYDALDNLVAEYSDQTSSNPTVSYMTTDGLGSPRVISDNDGNVISRRDFMPFGEELNAGTTNRTEANNFGSGADKVRKRFTGYEKDNETGLDFAEARYYDNRYGRFTAVDPMLASGQSSEPQTFNRFAYVANNPVRATDPSGCWSENYPNVTGWAYWSLVGELEDGPSVRFPIDYVEYKKTTTTTTVTYAKSSNPFSAVTFQRPIAVFTSVTVEETMDDELVSSSSTTAVAFSSVRAFAQGGRFYPLWKAHPKGIIHNPVTDVDKDGKLLYPNQCAIRMSIALINSWYGRAFKEFFSKNKNKTKDGFIIRAADLTKFITKLFGQPVQLKGDDKLEQVTGKTGVLYLSSFRGTVDTDRFFNHIDLWNRGRFGDGDYKWIDRAKKVLFWEIK